MTNETTSRRTSQPTDGHEGSLGSPYNLFFQFSTRKTICESFVKLWSRGSRQTLTRYDLFLWPLKSTSMSHICNKCLLFLITDRPTNEPSNQPKDRRTSQPTNRQTDVMVHREVALAINSWIYASKKITPLNRFILQIHPTHLILIDI